MKSSIKIWLAALSLGCMEPEVWVELEISGEILSDEEGSVELWFMHDRWGDAELETRFMVIETVWIDEPGEFHHVLEMPQSPGSGLSLYGWQDTNEDGEHCRPETPAELSGLETVDDLSGLMIEISLSLDVPCEGPEGL